jgi:hypothetical protein
MAFLTTRELKFYLIGVGLLTLIALFVTVLIMLIGGGGGQTPEDAAESGTEITGAGTADGEPSGTEEIFAPGERTVSRMKVPEEYRRLFEPSWKPFRRIHDTWSREQIDRYWIDPREIVEQQVKKESEKAVESFLEELP